MSANDATPAELHDRARAIRVVCFDVDGTLTDGRLVFDSEGRELKAFHVHDGQGLVLLRRAGLAVALVTARESTIAERRAVELGVEACTGVGDKLACVEGIARAHGVAMDQVAFMGDDLPDLKVMFHAGVSACPADAHPCVRTQARWHSAFDGGRGAAREFCDFLLQAQGRLDPVLDELLARKPAELGVQS